MEKRYKFKKPVYLNAVFSIDYILKDLEFSLESLNSKIASAPTIVELKFNINDFEDRIAILKSSLIVDRIEATESNGMFKIYFKDGLTFKLSSKCIFITLKVFTVSYTL